MTIKQFFKSIKDSIDPESYRAIMYIIDTDDELLEFDKDAINVNDIINQVHNLLTAKEFYDVFKEAVEEKTLTTLIEIDDTLSAYKKEIFSYFVSLFRDAFYSFDANLIGNICIEIELCKENGQIPTYAHDTDAGADVYCPIDIDVLPGTTLIPLGFKVAIPTGYELQMRPRSGLSLKTPLRIANAPGTIDSSYRDEVGVIMTNTSYQAYHINKGDRIAQMILAKVPHAYFKQVTQIDTTENRGGGFGSTDKPNEQNNT